MAKQSRKMKLMRLQEQAQALKLPSQKEQVLMQKSAGMETRADRDALMFSDYGAYVRADRARRKALGMATKRYAKQRQTRRRIQKTKEEMTAKKILRAKTGKQLKDVESKVYSFL